MASATAEQSNKITVSDAGPSRKKLSIEIPAEVVTERLEQSMAMIVRDAELPGYRRGRAPRQLIEKRFGAGVRSEAKQQLVSAAYSQAIEEHKLQVIGEPVSEGLASVELVSGKPLAFEIEVEVLPEFELPSLEGIALKKPVIEIDEKVIDKELETLSINEGTLESRESPEPGDYLTGHALMKADADGKVFYDLNGAVVQLPTTDKNGKGMILGVVVEDFSKQLGTPKPGDTATIKVTGPENHEVDALRGTAVTITFKVDRVDRIVPATTETLVQLFGMESEAQLRETLRKRAEQQIRIRQHTVMRTQVSKHLVESTKIDLPERITAQQAARTLDRRRMELMYRGASAQDIEMHIAELRESSSKIAERELRLSFILNKAAALLNVRIDESDVNNYIVQMAASQGARPDQLRQQLIQQNQIPGIVQTIREHKTLDAIVAKSTVTEMSPDEYNALVQAGQV
jgi:trigger factor